MRVPAPRPIALLLSCALLSLAAPAVADQHEAAPADVPPSRLTIRPAGLIFLLASPFAFAAAAPFAFIGGLFSGTRPMGKLADRLFVQPARYTFLRDAMDEE